VKRQNFDTFDVRFQPISKVENCIFKKIQGIHIQISFYLIFDGRSKFEFDAEICESTSWIFLAFIAFSSTSDPELGLCRSPVDPFACRLRAFWSNAGKPERPSSIFSAFSPIISELTDLAEFSCLMSSKSLQAQNREHLK
jgi:hypothetical protein